MSENSVFLVWHSHDLDEELDYKLLGVFSTRDRADARVARALLEDGFRDHPDNFVVDKYELDKDTWIEGFVTVHPDE